MDENILNLMSLAINKNPTEFYAQVDEILKSRAADAIDQARINVAANIYGGDVTESTDEDEEEFNFDLDDEDLDLDDLDLDLEDLEDDED